MSDSNRGNGTKIVGGITLVIILFLSIMLIYSSGRKHGEAIGEYSANADTYARHTQEHIKDCLTLAEDGSKTKCIIDEIEASNEHERAEKDLVAQTEMALWALGMLVVSTLMMLVSALGVWWIRDTLVETRKAVKAADDAVTVTREVGEAQVRAYVAPYEFSVVFDQNVGVADIHGMVRNSGQSPAHRFRHAYLVVNEPKDFDISKSKVDTFSPEAMLAANGATPLHEYITTGGEHDEGWVRRILSKEDSLWLIAEGEYFDVFGKMKHSYRKVIRADVGRSPIVFVVVEDIQNSEKA